MNEYEYLQSKSSEHRICKTEVCGSVLKKVLQKIHSDVMPGPVQLVYELVFEFDDYYANILNTDSPFSRFLHLLLLHATGVYHSHLSQSVAISPLLQSITPESLSSPEKIEKLIQHLNHFESKVDHEIITNIIEAIRSVTIGKKKEVVLNFSPMLLSAALHSPELTSDFELIELNDRRPEAVPECILESAVAVHSPKLPSAVLRSPERVSNFEPVNLNSLQGFPQSILDEDRNIIILPKNTAGHGACALHAVNGEWIDDRYCWEGNDDLARKAFAENLFHALFENGNADVIDQFKKVLFAIFEENAQAEFAANKNAFTNYPDVGHLFNNFMEQKRWNERILRRHDDARIQIFIEHCKKEIPANDTLRELLEIKRSENFAVLDWKKVILDHTAVLATYFDNLIDHAPYIAVKEMIRKFEEKKASERNAFYSSDQLHMAYLEIIENLSLIIGLPATK